MSFSKQLKIQFILISIQTHFRPDRQSVWLQFKWICCLIVFVFAILPIDWNIRQLDEINQLFLPNMRNKLMWFYQEVDEPESVAQPDQPKPGPSRAGGTSNPSKTPQGKTTNLSLNTGTKHHEWIQISFENQLLNLFVYSFKSWKERKKTGDNKISLNFDCIYRWANLRQMSFWLLPRFSSNTNYILFSTKEPHQPDRYTNINFSWQMDGIALSLASASIFFG